MKKVLSGKLRDGGEKNCTEQVVPGSDRPRQTVIRFLRHKDRPVVLQRAKHSQEPKSTSVRTYRDVVQQKRTPSVTESYIRQWRYYIPEA